MGKFVIKQTKSGSVKFDLKATNGQVVASSQVYKSERTARIEIASSGWSTSPRSSQM